MYEATLPHVTGQRQPKANSATGPQVSQRLRLPSCGSPGNRTYRLRSSVRRRCTQHLWGRSTTRREGAVEKPSQALNILRYACARTASSLPSDQPMCQQCMARGRTAGSACEPAHRLRGPGALSTAPFAAPAAAHPGTGPAAGSAGADACEGDENGRLGRAAAVWRTELASMAIAPGPAAACGGGAAHALQPHRHVEASCALSRSSR